MRSLTSGASRRMLVMSTTIPRVPGGPSPPWRTVFTYPAPRKLSDIMKVPLVKTRPSSEVKEMWKEYHRERDDALAESLPAAMFHTLKEKAKPCRYFVYPVFRDGGYFMLLSEFQDMCFLFTFLEDYRKNPKTANPWMSLTLYDEFVQDKGLGLLRGDVAAQLTRQEGQYLMEQLVDHYIKPEKYKTVWAFNHDTQRFSFDKYIRSMPRPVQKPKKP